jgi:hypothetical protein
MDAEAQESWADGNALVAQGELGGRQLEPVFGER